MPQVVRLFQYFKPSRYDVSLSLDKEKMLFAGSVKILGTLNSDRLTLHCKDLNIREVRINQQAKKFWLNPKDNELIVDAHKNNEEIEVLVEFTGIITRPMHGVYPCFGRKNEVILATQFESHHAREVFPCIDEPEAKAVFKLILTTNRNDIVLSNTKVLKVEKTGKSSTTYFQDTPKMSTYLLAFVSGDIKSVQGVTENGIKIQVWSTADQLQNTHFALNVAKKSLDFFEDYFKIPYPLEKCDLVALPDFAAGAMENWGLITFRETCLLVDKKNTSTEVKQYAAMVIAHELAHQWFGNLVTMRWWDDLWLNEGFASWIEFLAVDKLFPEWHMWSHFLSAEQLTAMRLDALKNTHPVQTTIKHPDDIRTNFDHISYAKGASIIHMLHDYLGKRDFRKGLTHYLSKHAYQNTQTDDLCDSLEKVSKKPVKKFMDTWVSRPGFPILKVSTNENQLEFSQQRFISDGSQIESSPWPIPVHISNNKITIEKKRDNYQYSAKQVLVLNPDHNGYYISRYWDNYYYSAAQMCSEGMLKETDRFGLLADTLALNKACLLPIESLMEIISSLKDDQTMPVWNIIGLVIADIRRIMSNEAKKQLKPFIKSFTNNQIKRLGWDRIKGENYYDRLLRPVMITFASGAGDIEVVKKAHAMFKHARSIEDIPPDYRHMVLICVSKTGRKAEFDKMLCFLQNTNSPEDRVTIINGLLHFKNKTEYMRGLNLIKTDHVRLQDVSYAILFGLSNSLAKKEAWLWLTNNWQWISDNLGDDMVFSRLPIYVAQSFSDSDFINEYRNFFETVKVPALELTIMQGLELMKMQIKWRNAYEKNLINWLSDL
jgi:aminopeptidase N